MCVEDLSSNCYHNIILLPVNSCATQYHIIYVCCSLRNMLCTTFVYFLYFNLHIQHVCNTYLVVLPVLGNDYTLGANPTTLTFPAGSTDSDDQCVMIDLEDDTRVEDTEDFTLDLMNPSSGMIGSQNSITVTINNLGMFT